MIDTEAETAAYSSCVLFWILDETTNGVQYISIDNGDGCVTSSFLHQGVVGYSLVNSLVQQ
jgi:hypothetical protein